MEPEEESACESSDPTNRIFPSASRVTPKRPQTQAQTQAQALAQTQAQAQALAQTQAQAQAQDIAQNVRSCLLLKMSAAVYCSKCTQLFIVRSLFLRSRFIDCRSLFFLPAKHTSQLNFTRLPCNRMTSQKRDKFSASGHVAENSSTSQSGRNWVVAKRTWDSMPPTERRQKKQANGSKTIVGTEARAM